MRICHLHIGPHKTATTTLQSCLRANSSRLASAGLYVPRMEDGKTKKFHHRLAIELGHDTSTRCRDRIASELREAGLPERIVISSENFSAWIRVPALRRRLVHFFSSLGYGLQIIAYIRPQISSVNSYYAQQIKTLHLDRRFDSYFELFLEAPQHNHFWRFRSLVLDRRIGAVFVPFSSAVLRGGICADFLARLGLDPATLQNYVFPEPMNVSPGPRTIEALIRIGEELARRGQSISREQLSFHAPKLRRRAAALGWDNAKFNGLGPDQKQRLMSRFGAANEEFARLAWNVAWQDHFAADEEKALKDERCRFDPDQINGAEFDEFCQFGLKLLARPLAAKKDFDQELEPVLSATDRATLRHRQRAQRKLRQQRKQRQSKSARP